LNKKNILFIATAFSPENAVGSVRTTKIVKFLVRNNYNITVISPKLHNGSSLDYSIECEELKQVGRITVPHSKLFESLLLKKRNKLLEKKSATNFIVNKNKKSLVSTIKSQFYIYVHFIYTILRNLDWTRKVKKQISENIDISCYDAVISSYPSLSAHWISSHLSKKHGLFWIADFRDPINYEANSNAIIIRINTYFQDKIINQSNFSTIVSNDFLKKINFKNKFDTNKLKYIPNGFDTDDLINKEIELDPSKKQLFKICYVGSLYGGKRNLEILFKTIKELINENKIEISKIEIIYAGKEFELLNVLSKKYNLKEILINKGFVSRLESMKIQSNSDLIVIATWNTKFDKGVMTGKLYECLLTKKMVLGIVNGTIPNSELKRVITDINGGIVYEDSALNLTEEYLHFKDYIHEKYNEKEKTGKLTSTYNSTIENFNYSKITNSFINLLNE
tara:strand:+ start:48657 stop:50006 length:1350 start_codon:yes stop_codon:yes gene_type:complete